MGKRGLEPRRLAAHDPKSCSSANSDTSPRTNNISLYPTCLKLLIDEPTVAILTKNSIEARIYPGKYSLQC